MEYRESSGYRRLTYYRRHLVANSTVDRDAVRQPRGSLPGYPRASLINTPSLPSLQFGKRTAYLAKMATGLPQYACPATILVRCAIWFPKVERECS